MNWPLKPVACRMDSAVSLSPGFSLRALNNRLRDETDGADQCLSCDLIVNVVIVIYPRSARKRASARLSAHSAQAARMTFLKGRVLTVGEISLLDLSARRTCSTGIHRLKSASSRQKAVHPARRSEF